MALWLCGWVGRGVWGPGDTLVLGRARLKLSPHSEDMLPPWATPGLQAEIANIQKEKERIATTTIDDELAADPELAKVRPAVVVLGGGQKLVVCDAGSKPSAAHPAHDHVHGVMVQVPAALIALSIPPIPPHPLCCRRWTRRCRRTTSWSELAC